VVAEGSPDCSVPNVNAKAIAATRTRTAKVKTEANNRRSHCSCRVRVRGGGAGADVAAASALSEGPAALSEGPAAAATGRWTGRGAPPGSAGAPEGPGAVVSTEDPPRLLPRIVMLSVGLPPGARSLLADPSYTRCRRLANSDRATVTGPGSTRPGARRTPSKRSIFGAGPSHRCPS
jgi:hypothetical protein